MYRLLKVLHLIGLALFLGSIASHIVTGAMAGPPGSASFVFAREQISWATRTLTMPGLALAILSGLGMVAASKLSLMRQRWLALHAALSLGIAAIAVTLIVPAGAKAVAMARSLSNGPLSAAADALLQVMSLETKAGAANLVLTLIVIVIGVVKPALGFRGRKRASQDDLSPAQ